MTVPKRLPDPGLPDFAAALLDSEAATPPGLVGPDGKLAPKRFNVYRNNVVVSLCEALEQTFPAIVNLLGEDYFKALARTFVIRHPPVSPVLIWYGAGFADFIESFPPLEAYPYLADVARVEWVWTEAYHAADAPALDPASLGAVPPDRVGAVTFTGHPAARVVVSQWPVWDLIRANRFPTQEAAPDIELTHSQDILVTRPDLEVGLYLQRPGAARFLSELFEGKSLGEAAAAAQAHCAEFALADCLSECLSSGAFTEMQVNG
ncbi:DNA-binding domain-containing protein [Roseibium sp.]|uniref:HvfC/BufC N-terminal domain-containing protein n=1 Tax=Roseibium sp. TaxID=1936156 RepID=UPI003D0D390C